MEITPNDAIAQLADLFRAYGPAMVLTGAGISTESGIPDFRSPGTGLYNSIDPMEYLSVQAMQSRPAVFWKYFTETFQPVAKVEPNGGHIALARLEADGYISAIATQNIDGLHQKAGSRSVFEVHGHLRTCHCYSCKNTFPSDTAFGQVHAGSLPTCPDCRGALRPDVVLFGDMMPEAFTQALDAARDCGLILVVGSSLTVSPANSLALESRRLAIINRKPTPFDEHAKVVISGASGVTLGALAEELGI